MSAPFHFGMFYEPISNANKLSHEIQAISSYFLTLPPGETTSEINTEEIT
jgi:hypothetical protein